MTPRQQRDTRDRLIEVAMQLFHEQGFTATSLKQILSRADVNPGSLYHFFKSKEELLLAVLDRYREGLRPVLLDPIWQGVEDPLERVFALLDGYRQGLVATDFAASCPIGNLALELDQFHPDALRRIADNFQGWRDAVRECLDAAADRLPADVDREKLAAFVLTTMEGGVMQARSYRKIEPFDDSVAMLGDYFERLQAQVKT